MAHAAQHVLLLTLGVFGAWTLRRHSQFVLVVSTMGSFWVVHAAAVVMYRYRDPIMPIMIVFAAIGFVALCRRRAVRSAT